MGECDTVRNLLLYVPLSVFTQSKTLLFVMPRVTNWLPSGRELRTAPAEEMHSGATPLRLLAYDNSVKQVNLVLIIARKSNVSA